MNLANGCSKSNLVRTTLLTGTAALTLIVHSPSQAQNTIVAGDQAEGGGTSNICSTSTGSVLVTVPFNSSIGCNSENSTIVANASSIGDDAQHSVVVGHFNTVGDAAKQSIVIGNGSGSLAIAGVALGTFADVGASAVNGIALGTSASVIAGGGLALGTQTKAENTNSVAIGTQARSRGRDSVALGTASDDGGQSNVISVGSSSLSRKIINVADGSIGNGSRDAVTGSQLFNTNSIIAARLGGGASVDAASGAFTGPVYNVAGGSFTNVGAALAALDNVNVNAIVYDNPGRTVATLGGTGAPAVSLRNLTAGNLASNSFEAVNGSQLFATNQNVTRHTTQITATVGSLGAGAAINGSTGAFTAPSFTVVGGTFSNVGSALDAMDTEIAKAIIYDNAGHTAATLGGTGATTPVSLRNLNAGNLSSTSTDAVNGGQLFSTNQKVTLNSNQITATVGSLGAGAAINGTTGAFTAPTFNVVGGTFNNVGSALTAMDVQIAQAIVYDNAGHTTATLGGAGATAPVSLRNVNAGSLDASSTEAINGAQLFSTNQKVAANAAHIDATLSGLGGGAGINAATGAFTGPSFNILGSSFANVGEALAALDNELTGAVFYDDKARSRATLGGAGVTAPVSLQNLAAGALNASSTEAVNGSQLFVTNENLDVLTTRVDDAESNFSNLNKGIANATVGIVQQDGGVSAGGVIRIGAASGGTSLSALGTEGVRVLSGLGAARLAIDSDEAVTGAQLFATNLLIQGNTEAIDDAVVSIGDTVSNVTNLTTAIQSGTIGLVQQDPTNLNIAVGADVGGNLVNIAGTDGNRVLTGLSAAALNASSTEAVNGAQLFATNQQIEGAIEDIGAIDVRVTDIETSLGDNINSVTNLTTAIQNGTIGLVQQDLSTRNVSVGSATDGLTVNFAGTAGNRRLTGIAAGTVSQNSTEAVNGAQLFTTDQTANNALRSATAAASGVSGAALALGGGARFDAASGNFTAPTFTVAGGSFNDVGSALLALDDEISNVSVAANNAVQYDNPERTAVTLGGQGAAVPVALRNVQAGTLSAASTDAVNGSQLFATNQAVAANTSAITNIDRRVTNLEGSVNGSNQAVQNLTTAIQNGTIGLVQQDPTTKEINVGSQTGGTAVNIAGTSGNRTIRGVKAGAISATSSEAVNGSQLFALQQSIDSGLSKVDNRLNSLDSRIGNVELDLRELRGEMDSAVASAIAIGMLPTSTNPGRFTLGMGTGVRAGQMATALGLSYRTTDDMFTMQARAAFDKEAVSVGVGMGLEF